MDRRLHRYRVAWLAVFVCFAVLCTHGYARGGGGGSDVSCPRQTLEQVAHANRSETPCPPPGQGSLLPDSYDSFGRQRRESVYGQRLGCTNSNWIQCVKENSDTCQLQCAAGFTRSSQDGHFECHGGSSTWTGNLKCEAVKCGALPRPENTKGGVDTYGGDPPEPHKGYIQDSRLCISAGNAVREGAPPKGNHTGDQRYFGDECTIECLKSWYPVHSARTIIYACTEPDPEGGGSQKDGVWCPGKDCWKTQPDRNTPNVRDEELECKEGFLSATRSNLYPDASSFGWVAEDSKQWPTEGADPTKSPKSIKAFGGPGTNAPSTEHAADSNGFLGYKFGDGKGPLVHFQIQAGDNNTAAPGGPRGRSYHNLKKVKSTDPQPDFVVIIIDRVKVQRIADACDNRHTDTCDKDLQPQIVYQAKSLPAEACRGTHGTCSTSGKYEQDRPYREMREGSSMIGTKEFNNDLTTMMSLQNDEDKDNGVFTLKHQFTEHGVFFIAAYMCPYHDKDCCLSKVDGGLRDDEQSKDKCKHAIVPGTGLYREVTCITTKCCDEEPYKYNDKCCALEDAPCHIDDNELPPSTFTICPQNTDTGGTGQDANGHIKGSALWRCQAREGFFSPEGDGRVAEKCSGEVQGLGGYTCPFRGMTWPVARPNFWVSPYDPSTAVRCDNLGACPGSKQFGVGSVNWQKCGSTDGFRCEHGFPQESCFVDGNPYTPDFCDKSTSIDCDKRIVRDDCFMTTNHIERGENDVNYRLADALNGDGTSDCFEQVGSRCCPGSQGKQGCNMCCQSDTIVGRHPSCYEKQQWYVVTVGEGGHCEICPPSEPGPMILMALLVVLSCVLITRTLRPYVKHAGAVSGPLLSLVTFGQTIDVLMGMGVYWPDGLRALARDWPAISNLDISAALNKLDFVRVWAKHLHIHLAIPNPQCLLHLPYEQKWLLTMLSPLLVLATYWLAAACMAIMRVARSLCRCAWSRRTARAVPSLPSGESEPLDIRPQSLSSMLSHVGTQSLRVVLFYLVVGYNNLVSTALQPRQCASQLDGLEYMTAASALDIRCERCANNQDEELLISYRQLASGAAIFSVCYGVGIPCLISCILYSNRRHLKDEHFLRTFGFLCAKMREEHYMWEVCISFRKLLVVLTIHNVKTLGQTGISLGICQIAVCVALAGQIWQKPYAYDDANITEALTLVATMMLLMLGSIGGVYHEPLPNIDDNVALDDGIICIVVVICIGWTMCVIVRACVKAYFFAKQSAQVPEGAAPPRELPVGVRALLHKRKLALATLWAELLPEGVEGDEAMARVTQAMASAREFREQTQISRVKDWEGFFLRQWRPAMYAWWHDQRTHEQEAVDDLGWFVQQLNELEGRHRSCAGMVSKAHDTTTECAPIDRSFGQSNSGIRSLLDDQRMSWSDLRDTQLLAAERRWNQQQTRLWQRAGQVCTDLADVCSEIFLGQYRGVRFTVPALGASKPAGTPVIQASSGARGVLRIDASAGDNFVFVYTTGVIEFAGVGDLTVDAHNRRMILAPNAIQCGATPYSRARAMGTFLVSMFSLVLTTVCVVQYQADLDENARYLAFHQGTHLYKDYNRTTQGCKDYGCMAKQPGTWLAVAILYWTVLVAVVLMILSCKLCRRICSRAPRMLHAPILSAAVLQRELQTVHHASHGGASSEDGGTDAVSIGGSE